MRRIPKNIAWLTLDDQITVSIKSTCSMEISEMRVSVLLANKRVEWIFFL